MQRRLYRLSIPAVALVALILSGPVAAGERVPFKGHSSGTSTTVAFDTSTMMATVHVEGDGTATHLGRFTVTGDLTLDVVTGIPVGTWTLTAANGDMLFLKMGGHGIDSTHGFGAFTIVGGTGRFEGATGYYEQVITFAFAPTAGINPMPYTDVLEGTISLRPK